LSGSLPLAPGEPLHFGDQIHIGQAFKSELHEYHASSIPRDFSTRGTARHAAIAAQSVSRGGRAAVDRATVIVVDDDGLARAGRVCATMPF
jgi:hypothetical protein